MARQVCPCSVKDMIRKEQLTDCFFTSFDRARSGISLAYLFRSKIIRRSAMVRNLCLVSFLLFFLSACAAVDDIPRPSDKEVLPQNAPTPAPPTPPTEKRRQPVASNSSAPAESVRNESGKLISPANNNLSKEQIQLVQELLKASGYNPGPIDGKVGPKTRSALQKYQASRLSNSGTPDNKT